MKRMEKPPVVDATPSFALESIEDLRAQATHEERWIWDGYLSANGITLLTSVWKSGKTTLLSVLLAKMRTGGKLAGLRVRKGRAVVLSEENRSLWVARDERLQFGGNTRFSCRPFRGRPTPAQWQSYIDQLAKEHQQRPINLLVIDPLSSFLSNRAENDSGSMMETLLPLQQLTSAGMSVLILHHPRKGAAIQGQAARGSGALTGCVDIFVEMNWHGTPNADDRRRQLSAWSRYERTPRRVLIELNADGTDYFLHGDFVADDFDQGWPVLLGVLEDATHKLSRRNILEQWPEDYPKPAPNTLWRWLDRANKDGLLLQEGTGRRYHPFVYWLKENEEKWANDPWQLPPLPGWNEQ